MRAVVFTGILRQDGGGGSTISQQLAKLLYSPGARNVQERIFHKLNEWVIAVRLERFFSKDEIIKLYFNKYDFGNGAIGIEAAARTYFNTTPCELNIQQSAMLVGMLQNSSLFNPNRRYERTLARRNVVLSQMQRNGFITRDEFDSLRQTPLGLDFRRMDHVDILAPYLGQELRRRLMVREPDRRNYHAWQNQQFIEDSIAWATDPLFGWAHRNPHPNGRPRDIFTGGYRIFTTIDSRMQCYV
jgi:penicillin-binding protein 1A